MERLVFNKEVNTFITSFNISMSILSNNNVSIINISSINVSNNDVLTNNVSNNDVSMINVSNNDASDNDIINVSTNNVSINDISNSDISNSDVSNNNDASDIDIITEKNRILEFEKNLTFELNDPYYYIDKNALTKETCEKIIQMFEESEQHEGITSTGFNINVKKTYEVNIRGDKWQEIDNMISNVLTNSIIKYGEKIKITTNNNYILHHLCNNVTDTGYQIQKYIKGDGFYNWHHDFLINNNDSCRIVTFLFYLNDVEEGGDTFFYNGKVKPEAGKLILFPATWTYNHKGNMPISNDKYIVTGWFYN
jgi:hypothetical protein